MCKILVEVKFEDFREFETNGMWCLQEHKGRWKGDKSHYEMFIGVNGDQRFVSEDVIKGVIEEDCYYELIFDLRHPEEVMEHTGRCAGEYIEVIVEVEPEEPLQPSLLDMLFLLFKSGNTNESRKKVRKWVNNVKLGTHINHCSSPGDITGT